MNDIEHLVTARYRHPDPDGPVVRELLECGHVVVVRELKPGLLVRRCPHCKTEKLKRQERHPTVRAYIAKLRKAAAEEVRP